MEYEGFILQLHIKFIHYTPNDLHLRHGKYLVIRGETVTRIPYTYVKVDSVINLDDECHAAVTEPKNDINEFY